MEGDRGRYRVLEPHEKKEVGPGTDPDPKPGPKPEPDPTLTLNLTLSQRRVIAQLATRMHGSAPFLLVGPFGTGKTRTLIEFLRRLVVKNGAAGAGGGKGGKRGGGGGTPAVRVLVCSPSNSSVDKYITALQDLLTPEQMLRLQSPHRNVAPPHVPGAKYSHVGKDGLYALPDRAALDSKLVVVSPLAPPD